MARFPGNTPSGLAQWLIDILEVSMLSCPELSTCQVVLTTMGGLTPVPWGQEKSNNLQLWQLGGKANKFSRTDCERLETTAVCIILLMVDDY